MFPYLGEPHADVVVPELSGASFVASLSGRTEVPAVESPASGVTALSSTGTEIEHLTLTHKLTGAVQGHIHLGDPGENGPVVVFLYGPTDGEDVNGTLSSGTITGDDPVTGTLDDLNDVLRGGFGYVNIHTHANPGGEIRGQVRALEMVENAFRDDDGSVHEANIDLIAAAGIT